MLRRFGNTTWKIRTNEINEQGEKVHLVKKVSAYETISKHVIAIGEDSFSLFTKEQLKEMIKILDNIESEKKEYNK